MTVVLPEGFTLDSAEAPAGFGSAPISEYKPSASVSKDGRTVIYRRKFFFGGGGNIIFPVASYAQLKNYFDQLHKQDNHILTLKQSASTAAK